MTTGLQVFDKTVAETNRWLGQLMERLGTADRHLAYTLLRATLHAIRDRMGPENAVHLGAQLPLLLRGVYYEGWRPSRRATKERHVDLFLDHVLAEVATALDRPEAAIAATLGTIRSNIDPGEALKIIHLFPAELRDLWLAA